MANVYEEDGEIYLISPRSNVKTRSNTSPVNKNGSNLYSKPPNKKPPKPNAGPAIQIPPKSGKPNIQLPPKKHRKPPVPKRPSGSIGGRTQSMSFSMMPKQGSYSSLNNAIKDSPRNEVVNVDYNLEEGVLNDIPLIQVKPKSARNRTQSNTLRKAKSSTENTNTLKLSTKSKQKSLVMSPRKKKEKKRTSSNSNKSLYKSAPNVSELNKKPEIQNELDINLTDSEKITRDSVKKALNTQEVKWGRSADAEAIMAMLKLEAERDPRNEVKTIKVEATPV